VVRGTRAQLPAAHHRAIRDRVTAVLALTGARSVDRGTAHHPTRRSRADRPSTQQRLDGALPADPAVDVSATIAAPWEHTGSSGWMTLSVIRRAGRWQATHGMDGRPLAPYVSPSERWPAAGELFGPIWRLRDLRPDGGEASLPPRSVGLTFTRGAPASVSVRINGSERTGDAASCDAEDGTPRFGNWANNLVGPTAGLYGQQRILFFAILDGDVARALQPSTSEDHLELTTQAVGLIAPRSPADMTSRARTHLALRPRFCRIECPHSRWQFAPTRGLAQRCRASPAAPGGCPRSRCTNGSRAARTGRAIDPYGR
jgi:hypothetical protein